MMALEERLNLAEQKIKTPNFRENKGLGNEVGYYVFDYPAEAELTVRARVAFIKNKYQPGGDGFQVVVYDLYDLIIGLLKEKGFLQKCFDFEKAKGFERVTTSVGNMLRISDHDGLLIRRIKDDTPKNSVVFLTGIGKCYPFLRSHKLLNNLHQVIDDVPVVLFYPGKYDGQELVLFGEIKDDNYYRAFRLVD
jgi:hypothetical protein